MSNFLLPAAELTELRRVAELTMNSTCDIYTVAVVNDKGSVTKVATLRGNDIPCRFMPTSSRDIKTYLVGSAQKAIRASWFLTISWDTEINITDRVVFGSSTYEVLGVKDVGDFRTARRAELKEAE